MTFTDQNFPSAFCVCVVKTCRRVLSQELVFISTLTLWRQEGKRGEKQTVKKHRLECVNISFRLRHPHEALKRPTQRSEGMTTFLLLLSLELYIGSERRAFSCWQNLRRDFFPSSLGSQNHCLRHN